MSEKKLGDILKNLYRDKGNKGPYYEAKIKAKWEEMFGPIIIRYTSGIRLENQTLFVKITSAPLKNELAMGKEQILRTVNESLGETYVDKIVFL